MWLDPRSLQSRVGSNTWAKAQQLFLQNRVLALAMALSLGSCALAEDVSLRVWVGDNQDIDWINKVIENFKAAHPENNYTIEVGVQTEGDCSKVVLTDPTAEYNLTQIAGILGSTERPVAKQSVQKEVDRLVDAGSAESSRRSGHHRGPATHP